MSKSASSNVVVDKDGTVHIPAYSVPLSIHMSDEAKRLYTDLRTNWPSDVALSADMLENRAALDRWVIPQLEQARAAYPVNVKTREIAGVRVEVVTPKDGIASRNEGRVLINLHGGAFFMGAGAVQLIEAIPIAGTAGIKVISIDYRQSPEHRFPAASEDVAAVYGELIKQYSPPNIGLYGHSSGGTLAAMSVAWFRKHGLPRPGAIGMFSSHDITNGGDSFFMAPPLSPLFNSRTPAPPLLPSPVPMNLAYFAGVDPDDPLVSPMRHPDQLAEFPPTLIVTGTRDPFASGLIRLHRQLVKAGVHSQLELWESMWHGFIQHVDMPEAQEMYEVTAAFFDRHLGS